MPRDVNKGQLKKVQQALESKWAAESLKREVGNEVTNALTKYGGKGSRTEELRRVAWTAFQPALKKYVTYARRELDEGEYVVRFGTFFRFLVHQRIKNYLNRS